MRLLLVTDYFADPPVIGTTVIAAHWARLLRRRGHRVDLFCGRERWDARWDRFLAEHGIGRPTLSEPPWRGRIGQALAVVRGEPPSVAHVRARRTAAALTADPGMPYDAAIVIGPALLPLAEELQRCMRVVYAPVDAVSMVLESRCAHARPGLGRLRLALEARLWRRLEATRFPGLGAVVFVAPADARAAMRRWPDRARERVHVIPNGVDAAYFRPAGSAVRPTELVFTGNLWSDDSVLGARWFADEVLPRVAASVPDVRFLMAGRDPAPALLERARRGRGIEVRPNVPDLRPFLDEAAVYVCPLVSGGGVKNRLLEALAMGKATVATTSCAEALGLESGRQLLAVDGPAAFADAVVRLLRDAALRAELGAAARAVVLERFTWDAGVDRLEAIIAGLG